MKFLIPVPNTCVITSRFNTYRDYSKIAPNRLQLHEGLDYAPSPPTDAPVPVYVAQNGIVEFKGVDSRGYGNYLIVKHSDRFYTVYAHLENYEVSGNQTVKAGEQIGTMGATGNATGKHLHFTIQDLKLGLDNYVYPKVVDPFPLMVNKIDSLQVSEVCYNIISRIIHMENDN